MRPVIALLLHNRNGNASKARRPRWEALAANPRPPRMHMPTILKALAHRAPNDR